MYANQVHLLAQRRSRFKAAERTIYRHAPNTLTELSESDLAYMIVERNRRKSLHACGLTVGVVFEVPYDSKDRVRALFYGDKGVGQATSKVKGCTSDPCFFADFSFAGLRSSLLRLARHGIVSTGAKSG